MAGRPRVPGRAGENKGGAGAVGGRYGRVSGTLDTLKGFSRGEIGVVSPADRADTDFVIQIGGLAAVALNPEFAGTLAEPETIEAMYQAKYASAYEQGLAKVEQEMAAGRLKAPLGQPEHLFKANRVDDFARSELRLFAEQQGHGTDVVRINQRLYLDSGKYRIPDVYFPQSGTILDGTLGTKTWATPQIVDFAAANGNSPIGIVRPQVYGGSYWLRK